MIAYFWEQTRQLTEKTFYTDTQACFLVSKLLLKNSLHRGQAQVVSSKTTWHIISHIIKCWLILSCWHSVSLTRNPSCWWSLPLLQLDCVISTFNLIVWQGAHPPITLQLSAVGRQIKHSGTVYVGGFLTLCPSFLLVCCLISLAAAWSPVPLCGVCTFTLFLCGFTPTVQWHACQA